MRSLVAALLLSAVVVGCGGTTGSGLVAFAGAAAGPADAPASGSWAFDTPLGFHITLTRATLHVGAIYLNASVPVSGAQATSCILPGIYVAEVTKGRDIDLLDPTPQPFPTDGEGKAEAAAAAEVWLMGTADVNAQADVTPILVVAGSAGDGTTTRSFSGTLTIGANRVTKPTNAAEPGSHPLCKERIVTPIPTDITPQPGGTLVARIDPRQLFASVNFTDPDFLAKDGTPDGTAVVFDDDSNTTPSRTLYQALHAAALVYRFEWLPTGP
jgi:hypothetical protein